MSREYTHHIDRLAESYYESQREETLAHIAGEIEFARSLEERDERLNGHRYSSTNRLLNFVFLLGPCSKCGGWLPLRFATPVDKARNTSGRCVSCWPGIWTGPSYFCIKDDYKKWPLPKWFRKWVER